MTGLEHDLRELKEQYERQESAFPPGTQKDVAYKKWYLKQLNLIAYKYKNLEGTAAQSALTALNIQRRSLEKSLPGRFKGVKRFFRQLRNALIGNKVEQRIITQQDDGRQRILYQLRQAGLGKMIDKAEELMKYGLPKFSLTNSQEVFPNQTLDCDVGFSKDDTGKYVLTYKARLATEGKDGVEFRTLDNGDNGLLSNERATNLLCGQAIKHHYFIQGKQFSEWLSLDLNDLNAAGAARIKRFDTSFGYDLPAALDQLNSNGKRLLEPKDEIIRKLENGNQVPIRLADQDKELHLRIAADPLSKGVAFYDQMGKQISQEKALATEKAKSQGIRVPVPRPNRKFKIHR